MRWKLCKIYKKLPSDDFFKNIIPEEMMWLDAMVAQDEEEDFLRTKSFTEYLACFIDPAAVKSVREREKNTVSVSDEDFIKTIEQMEGRVLSSEERASLIKKG